MIRPQVKIGGEWVTPPQENIESWIREPVCVIVDIKTLSPIGIVPRYKKITHIRKSPRHKAENVTIT